MEKANGIRKERNKERKIRKGRATRRAKEKKAKEKTRIEIKNRKE